MTESERGTISQAIRAVSDAVHALPPAFVILALMNCVFLGALFFYLLEQQSDRTGLLKQVLDSCVVKQ
jgi:hypothetical protein